MAVTVQVAVSNATFHFDKPYTYLVPAALESRVNIGSMVLVPFGMSKTAAPRMGVVLQAQHNQEQELSPKTKYIIDVAPEKAQLSGELLELVYYLKERTFCSYFEAVKAIIPYGAQYKAVANGGSYALQKQLVRHTQPTYIATEYSGRLTEKQRAVLQLAQAVTARDELRQAGVSDAILKVLCDKGALIKGEADVTISIYDTNIPPKEEIVLSTEQQAVFDELNGYLSQPDAQAALLYGVTSSGKTLVFIKLIEMALSQNKQALVLVPEISLTPQMIYRLKSHFGKRVSVQHSALSNTERLLEWQQIQNNAADIVVGTRSAVFAPLSRLGLIIIDEEQEHTYHSDQAPRYDAREIAKMRAVTNNALLLLASATPSMQTYYNARQGRIRLLKLSKRYNDMPMPQVTLVDMRKELNEGNAGAISKPLAQEMAINISQGKQTILLLNRRGYKTVGVCGSCSAALKCSSCSVPMVYHKTDDKLLCHYCGKAIAPIPEQCPQCGGKMRYTGFGTQRVEEELQLLFPCARILRMDLDTTSRKNSHEKMLARFSAGEYDIMIGTQMVAKGLDFERVTLVGVLGVDQLLFAQGYKAFETVFSLITQVVGRGGRRGEAGRAIIQTVDPLHPVLSLAAKQDYEAFYSEEISFRELNIYPPFCTICVAGFTGIKEDATLAAANSFKEMLVAHAKRSTKQPLRILGPAPMNIVMLNDKYRFKLTIKCKNTKMFRGLMSSALAEYNSKGLVSRASVYLDFNSNSDI